MRIRKTITFLLILLFQSNFGKAQNLVINELMSANVSTITDEDGDYSDWIEMYNADAIRIDLNNFGLSDDESEPHKWIFPEVSLEPKSYLLIFASGKDIRIIPRHWETIIDWGDEWKYLVPHAELSANWRTLEFDDSDWHGGPSGFGYGDHDDATDVGSDDPFNPSPISIFVRKKFMINNIDDIVGAILHIDYDDGFVAYLNGVEIARANMGYAGIMPQFNQFATEPHEAQIYQGGRPEEIFVEQFQSILRAGTNILTIQVHNVELYSSDLTLIPFFTLEMTTVPQNSHGSSPHLQFPASPKLHTNFKIKASGEILTLCDSSGKIIDKVESGYTPANISFGRQPDGSSSWYFFDEPTPGSANNTKGYLEFAPEPQFSRPGGFYRNNFLLELSAPSPDLLIRYTMDGSLPVDTSIIYSLPILIDSTTVIRARVFDHNLLPSNTGTQTYFINQEFAIPVVSLTTDPANLWDDDIGIYVYGKHADTLNYPYWGSNFWQDWERPIHIEFYEPDGRLGFDIDAGVQIFGSWSRLYPQKALAIFARANYGYEDINYQIFPDKPITTFQSIILRNSGQDWGRTFFRDAMMQSLVKENTDLDIQAYLPAMVFLNGKIWGIHNIREKMNEHYLASNRGVDPDNIDFIERDSMIIKGDTEHYQNLLNYIASHDIHLQSSYDYVKTQMDVGNFMDYTLSVIYFANSDWPWNNVKCWRPRTHNGKWKWLLYDLDYGFHGGHLGPDANVFNEMRNQQNGTTFIFFKLLKNEEHRNAFINRFADHLNITFNPARVIHIINKFKAGIESEMPFHIAKWKNSFVGPWWLGKSIDSMEEWYSHIQVTIDFAERRADYVLQQLMDEFALTDGGMARVNLDISPIKGGKIKINSQIIDFYPWSGDYFKEIPIRLTAIPNQGFRFSHWQGVSLMDSATVDVTITDDQSINAVFESDSGMVVINEINYRSADDFNSEDWVELYNNSNTNRDISGWILKDAEESHQFLFPNKTAFKAKSYLVLCRDTTAFLQTYPHVNNRLGNFNFGLSSDGELIRLFDILGNVIDSLTYDESSPWPEQANGNGYTLELINPNLDNTLPQHWAASVIVGGTPGSANSVFTQVYRDCWQQPITFYLSQNYPNPFNSQTTIQFSLPQSEKTSFKIYNILGEEINVLINDTITSGIFKVIWDGKDKNSKSACSGIYLYQLKSESFQQIKKMILIR